MLNRVSSRKGFTLIELMIVIAIIAILAAILVPNFVRARAQGQLTACKSNLKNVGTALEMYAVDHNGRYPTQLTLLTTARGLLCPAFRGAILSLLCARSLFFVTLFEFEKHDIFRCGDSIIRQGGNLGRA